MAFYAFDLTSDGDACRNSDWYVPMIRTGALQLQIRFGGDPLPLECRCVLLCEFPSLMTIHDKNREVTMSYYIGQNM